MLVSLPPCHAADSTISGMARVRDTYLQDRFGGDDNYGGAATMPVGWKDDDYPQSHRRLYIWFDLPQNIDTCAACSLSLYLTDLDGDPDTLDLFWCERSVFGFSGDNTLTADSEDGEMTWLNYYDDDDGVDSSWIAAGGDFDADELLGSFVYSGSESVERRYALAIRKSAADSLLSGARPNYGIFIIGRVGGAYGSGNTLATFRQVDYSDHSYGPEIIFYDVGTAAPQISVPARRRALTAR